MGMRMGMGEDNAKIQSFKQLDAWKCGHAVVLKTYSITKDFPKEEQFGITNQMRRASVSITSNIAEGFGRQGKKDKAQFYAIAKGSALELQSQLCVAKDLRYITDEIYDTLDVDIDRVIRLTYGLIRSALR
jgi:four helix bundle protein